MKRIDSYIFKSENFLFTLEVWLSVSSNLNLNLNLVLLGLG